jgi:hypothetical protein
MRVADLTGTHAAGTVQMAEQALNEVMRRLTPAASTHTLVQLQPGNTVMVRYGLLHARAQLPSAVTEDELPRVTFRMASVLVAWGIKAAVRRPFLHVHGRFVSIDLSAVPELSAWSEWWRHLRRLSFEVVPGALRVGFVVSINEEAATDVPVQEHA